MIIKEENKKGNEKILPTNDILPRIRHVHHLVLLIVIYQNSLYRFLFYFIFLYQISTY